MFEVPQAKRVKRSALLQQDHDDEHASSTRSTPERSIFEQDQVQPDYGFEYNFIEHNISGNAVKTDHYPPSPENLQDSTASQGAYEFRLFKTPRGSPTPKSTSTTQPDQQQLCHPKISISLRSPSPSDPSAQAQAQGRFTQPNRPQTYYFTSAIPKSTIETLRNQYTSISLSTNDILTQSLTTKWPGTSLPWRVIHLKSSTPTPPSPANPNSITVKTVSTAQPLSRDRTRSKIKTKPSKKRRIILRRQLAERKRQQQLVQAKAEGKRLELTEEEKEKRTKRNREKKVKRKEREKKKKMASAAEDGVGGVDDEDDDSATERKGG